VPRGRSTYIQYWFYYPDSPSTFMGSHAILNFLGIHDPAFHKDDWEGFQVRVDPDGTEWVRATAHGHYQWCKHFWCKNEWGRGTGWTRVSRGSHAGHIPLEASPHLKRWGIGIDYKPLRPGAGLDERSTTAPSLNLVPLETVPHRTYKPLPGGIKPPWTKRVYSDPAANSS
jgi:hypothetical protein